MKSGRIKSLEFEPEDLVSALGYLDKKLLFVAAISQITFVDIADTIIDNFDNDDKAFIANRILNKITPKDGVRALTRAMNEIDDGLCTLRDAIERISN
jgi:hypothetical protein